MMMIQTIIRIICIEPVPESESRIHQNADQETKEIESVGLIWSTSAEEDETERTRSH